MESGTAGDDPPALRRDDGLGLLRFLIWSYLVLLVFEGALRKWVMPGLSTPLLLVRDPVLVAIYLVALSRGAFPMNGWVLLTGAVGGAALLASFAFSTLPAAVILFGLRASFLHVPLIFVIGAAFDRRDVLRVGLFWILLAVPMAWIVFNQFNSPPGAWWNLTPGGGEAMKGALERARATGTFSFSAGLSSYVGLLAAFLLAGVFGLRAAGRPWLLAGACALGAILVFSAARSVLLVVLFVGACAVVASFFKPSLLPKLALAGMACGLIWLLVNDLDFVRQGIGVHEARFTDAAKVEGSTFRRVYEGYIPPVHLVLQAPVIGVGLGLGTNAGAAFLYGAPMFLLSEGEAGRAFGEMGSVLGTLYLCLRWGLALWLGLKAWVCLRAGNPLPLLILGIAHHELIKGQWGIATSLGFGIVSAGLCLAAMNDPPEQEPSDEDVPAPDAGEENAPA